MLEGWADNLEQKKFIDALRFGTYEANKVIQCIKASKYSQRPKIKFNTEQNVYRENLKMTIRQHTEEKIRSVFSDHTHDKQSRDQAIQDIRYSVLPKIEELTTKDPNLMYEVYSEVVKDILRELVLDGKRCDGRQMNEVRPISCEVNMFGNLHGSALFQRGQTQVLCSLTFDSPELMYKSEIASNMVSPSLTKLDKNFMLHYEFPPYSTNEIDRVSGRADRREIGHGALAEKAVYPIVPNDNPFTIRLLCEVLESNGSSSMASVCAGSLALVGAGVKIAEPVCGVAMGLVSRLNDDQKITDYKIMTDISVINQYNF